MFNFKRLRKEEVAALSGPNEFAEFYSRLRSLKDYHRKFPNEVYFATFNILRVLCLGELGMYGHVFFRKGVLTATVG